jgi:enediyne biosynthesis protein E4
VLRGVPPSGKHWISLELRGMNNRSVVGTRVRIVTKDGTQSRFMTSGGYLSSHAPQLHVGLGDASVVDRIEVEWAFGKSQQWNSLPSNRRWVLSEGDPRAKSTAP